MICVLKFVHLLCCGHQYEQTDEALLEAIEVLYNRAVKLMRGEAGFGTHLVQCIIILWLTDGSTSAKK